MRPAGRRNWQPSTRLTDSNTKLRMLRVARLWKRSRPVFRKKKRSMRP